MATIQEVCERWANLNIEDIINKSIKDSEQDIITAQIDQMILDNIHLQKWAHFQLMLLKNTLKIH